MLSRKWGMFRLRSCRHIWKRSMASRSSQRSSHSSRQLCKIWNGRTNFARTQYPFRRKNPYRRPESSNWHPGWSVQKHRPIRFREYTSWPWNFWLLTACMTGPSASTAASARWVCAFTTAAPSNSPSSLCYRIRPRRSWTPSCMKSLMPWSVLVTAMIGSGSRNAWRLEPSPYVVGKLLCPKENGGRGAASAAKSSTGIASLRG